jgi:hypothetical protein
MMLAEKLSILLQGMATDLAAYIKKRTTKHPTAKRRRRLELAELLVQDVSRWATLLARSGTLSRGAQLEVATRIAQELARYLPRKPSKGSSRPRPLSTGSTTSGTTTSSSTPSPPSTPLLEDDSGLFPTLVKRYHAQLEQCLRDQAAFTLQRALVRTVLHREHSRRNEQSLVRMNEAYETLMNGALFKGAGTSFRAVSAANLANLETLLGVTLETNRVKPPAGLSLQEKRLYLFLLTTKLYLTHGSDFAEKIVEEGGTGRLLSNVEVTKRFPKQSTNTYEKDVKIYANHDFVFFTLDLGPKQKYGSQCFVFDADQVKFFEHGWFSYADFANGGPLKKEINAKQLVDPRYGTGVVRRYADFTVEKHGSEKYTRGYVLEYPRSKTTWPLDLTQMVFFGPDMRPGLALTLIHELRLMKLVDSLAFVQDSDLPAQVSRMLNTLYFLEAKMPADVYTRFVRPNARSPEQLTLETWDRRDF